MQALPADFIKNPTQDLAAFQKKIQDFWDSLPPLVSRGPQTRQDREPIDERDRPADAPPRGVRPDQRRGRRSAVDAGAAPYSLLTRRDKIVLGLMVGIPAFIQSS